MTKREPKTVPAHDWVLNLQQHRPSSESEALMMDDDDWRPRDESLMDLVEEILTDEEEEVVSMVVLGGMSYRQVARATGFSVGKCHALKQRAIEKLRKALTEDEEV